MDIFRLQNEIEYFTANPEALREYRDAHTARGSAVQQTRDQIRNAYRPAASPSAGTATPPLPAALVASSNARRVVGGTGRTPVTPLTPARQSPVVLGTPTPHHGALQDRLGTSPAATVAAGASPVVAATTGAAYAVPPLAPSPPPAHRPAPLVVASEPLIPPHPATNGLVQF